jgi:3-phenylpropionate/cinnamic acid dioxygenase small subunit
VSERTALADELAIRQTLAIYCHHCDDAKFDELVDQFTSDGSFSYQGEVMRGHEQLRAWFEDKQPPDRRGKHLTTNSVVDIDGDRAYAKSDFVFLRLPEGSTNPVIAVAGRYHDELHRIGDRWLIDRREVQVMSAAT